MAKIERDPVEDKVKESEIFVSLFREREKQRDGLFGDWVDFAVSFWVHAIVMKRKNENPKINKCTQNCQNKCHIVVLIAN